MCVGEGGDMSFNVFALKITSECIFFILEADIADNNRYLSVSPVTLKKDIGFHLFGETKEISLDMIKPPFC